MYGGREALPDDHKFRGQRGRVRARYRRPQLGRGTEKIGETSQRKTNLQLASGAFSCKVAPFTPAGERTKKAPSRGGRTGSNGQQHPVVIDCEVLQKRRSRCTTLGDALHGPSGLMTCRLKASGDWRPLVMKHKTRSKGKLRTPKTILRLPDLEVAKSAVLNSLSCPDAQRGYRHAIDEFVDWYCSEPRLSFSKTVVVRYRMHLESRNLAPGTINLRLGAVRRLAYEAADCGLLSADLAAGIRRVKGVKKLGVRLGNWLTADQSQALWPAPDRDRIKGKRDRALLAVLLACGLRRHELAALTVDHLQQREGHWAIVDLRGKAGHVRTVPSPIGCAVSWATG
jgi:hypothetical protein